MADKTDKNPESTLNQFRLIFRKVNMRLSNFILPMSLGLIAAFFEGISVSFLLPLAKGVIKMDFGFVREYPIFSKPLFNFIKPYFASDLFIFVFLIGVVFSTAVLKDVLQYFSSLAVAYQIRKFNSRLRKIIFERYLSFGKLFFDSSDAGHLNYVLLGCSNAIVSQIRELYNIFSKTFMFLVYLIIMFVISWKMTILMIFIFPLSNYSLRWLIEKLRKTSKSYTIAHINLNRKAFNVLSCIPLVKAYSQEQKEKEGFGAISESAARWEFSIDKKSQLISPLQDILLLIAILLLVSFMAFMVTRGSAGRIGSFLVFFYVLRRASDGFRITTQVKSILARISGSLSEVFRAFDDKDKYFVAEGEKEFMGLEREISFRHLNFSYIDDIPVLGGLNFSIKKNEMTAIVGPTGAGKTTIINLIVRYYDCPANSIFIDDTDIREFTLESLRKHIALVSQEIFLFNDTLRNNITYGAEETVNEEKLTDILKKARLSEFIMKLPKGLDTAVGDRGVKLSGGEKQRVAIARALLKGSEILILDEATSSLDTRTERLIQEAIEEAIKGRTTIVIAHRLSTIRNANKIIVIEEGRLVEEGTLGELLGRKGKFYQYWEAQKFY